VWCGLSGAALVEEDAAVVGRIEIASAKQISVYFIEALRGCALPVSIINSTAWSSMKVHDRNALWIATFFVVDRVDWGDLKMARSIRCKGSVERRHFDRLEVDGLEMNL
jgi:hypothetical protein